MANLAHLLAAKEEWLMRRGLRYISQEAAVRRGGYGFCAWTGTQDKNAGTDEPNRPDHKANGIDVRSRLKTKRLKASSRTGRRVVIKL